MKGLLSLVFMLGATLFTATGWGMLLMMVGRAGNGVPIILTGLALAVVIRGMWSHL